MLLSALRMRGKRVFVLSFGSLKLIFIPDTKALTPKEVKRVKKKTRTTMRKQRLPVKLLMRR